MSYKEFVQRARDKNLMEIVINSGRKFVKGRNLIKIRCEFHNEKTPSLAIYESSYRCYSCGEHGDVIGWVMKIGKVDFKTAVMLLNTKL